MYETSDGGPCEGMRVRTASHSGRAPVRRGEDAAAIAIYVALWVVFIGRVAVTDPAHTCACPGEGDPASYMWALVWWPHALVHGLNPFISHVVWTPEGGNVAAAALIPAAAVALSPVTAAFGPIVGYNLLSLLGPVLSAWLTFRLCRYVTGRWGPSLVGGYIFGFSSYVLAHTLGHPNLILVFLVPAAVHLVLLWLDERLSPRRFVVLMTGLLTLQFLLSTEVLVTMLGFGSVALALTYVLSPERRDRIRALVPKLLGAGGLSAVLVSPYLYYALKGLGTNPSVNYTVTADRYSADPLNYVLPTPVTWVGHGLTDSLAAKFNSIDSTHGNFTEAAAYLGLPLVLILGLFLFAHRRRASAQVAMGLLAVLFVASLGAHLHIANPPDEAGAYRPSIPLPWRLVNQLPVVERALPARFSMYVSLIAAVVVAQWLSEPARRAWARWLLAGLAVLALIPNQSLPYWRGKPADPAFFTTEAYRDHLTRDETTLVIPYGWNGNSMLWQAETNMYFRMAGGYLSSEVPVDYWRDPVVQALLAPPGSQVVTPARYRLPLRDFLVRRRVGAVILAGDGSGAWRPVLESLGLRPRRVDGVIVYDVSGRRRRLPGL
jgi:hypothetical protein